MKALLGVDIGTQGTKTALFSVDGELLSSAFEPSVLLHPTPETIEEDPERQVQSVIHTIRKCVQQSKIDPANIVGIGIDGQMAGVIGVDRSGHHITNYDSWLDNRCAGQIASMNALAGQAILNKTGCVPSLNHGPKILWWKRERKQFYQRIVAFVQPGAYAAMRLCELTGAEAFIDHTYLHFSGFADNAARKWDVKLCKTFGVEADKLPCIVEPQKVIGVVSKAIAQRCGLKVGTPVVAGCGDTAASFLACGAVKPGIAVDVAGTAAVFAATTHYFQPDTKAGILGCGQSAVPGLWHPYAYINGSGLNLSWFQRELGSIGKHQFSLAQLDKEAEKIVLALDNPYFVPHLGGRVCPAQPNLRGGWVGLAWNHNRGHLYRAILESVALEYGIYQRVLTTLYPQNKLQELRVTGGGEKSKLWNQIKADALGIPTYQIQGAVGAPMGVAMLAGWGVREFKNLPSVAEKWIYRAGRQNPNTQNTKYYTSRKSSYEKLLTAFNDITFAE